MDGYMENPSSWCIVIGCLYIFIWDMFAKNNFIVFGVSKNRATPMDGWFLTEHIMKMDDGWGAPIFQETIISQELSSINLSGVLQLARSVHKKRYLFYMHYLD